jgi:hypothetical protein
MVLLGVFTDSYVPEVIIDREKRRKRSRIFFKMFFKELTKFYVFTVRLELVKLL